MGGHSLIGFCLLMIAVSHQYQRGYLCLFFMCLLVFTFQSTIGGAFYLYTSEVGTDKAMGLSVFTMMTFLYLQSAFTHTLVDWFGVDGLFYTMGVLQAITCGTLHKFLKETKGLGYKDKKNLYIEN